MKRFLGIDYGVKKIGLAVGDDEMRIAFARPALLDVDDQRAAIMILCAAEEIHDVVIGLPQSTDGTESEQTVLAKEFITSLSPDLTVHLVDERFSTQGVQRQQQHRKLERGQEDSLVAQALLQSFLDSQ